jgi:hypothetical protein
MSTKNIMAFPSNKIGYTSSGSVQIVSSVRGMTLRDYFAAKALNGLCNQIELTQSENFMMKVATGVMAKLAYQLADAMLEARDK